MKFLIVLSVLITQFLIAQELKVKANAFDMDDKKGISIFTGDVSIVRGKDELNASKVTIMTDKKHNPIKFIALGNVSFLIQSENGLKYKGKAGKVIYIPKKKEYYFYKNVHLKQLNEKKEIMGDEVVLKAIDGKAYAKGAKSEPVIMIFNIDNNETKEK